MRRREFIAGISAAAWPLAARAQQSERMRRVGVLTYGSDTPDGRRPLSVLRDVLEQLGWSEGRNLRLDFRFGSGDATQTRVFAADLVQLAPDVIVTLYTVDSAPCNNRLRRFQSYSWETATPSKTGR